MRLPLIFCLILTALTVLVFAGVCRNDFVNYDDYAYVSQNPHIAKGVTREALKWALTAGFFSPEPNIDTDHLDYWQPVTAVSRILDMQFYGVKPAGHHLTNLILHVFNVLLLFLILRKTTGVVYRSALAAAVFGIHPVQVEAVAWVTARKDVLSMFFGLLAVWAYAGYAGKPGWKRGTAVFIFFALALMSKPVFVTLPFVLLLLDYWPLARVSQALGNREKLRAWLRLAAEKWPLFALAFFFGVLVMHTRTGTLFHVPLAVQTANAIIYYVWYAVQWLTPRNFSVWYCYPGADSANPPFPFWAAGGAFVLCAAVTFAVFRHGRRKPYLPAGWLWYLVTLSPVIGLRPADRFMYLPAVGLAILTAWGMPDLLSGLRLHKKVAGTGLIAVAAYWGILSAVQTGYWKDTETLFRHAVQVTKNNFKMHYSLGFLLHNQGREDEAVTQYQETIRINPFFPEVYNNLGTIFYRRDRLEEARRCFLSAIRLDPSNPGGYRNFITVLIREGKLEEAKCLHALAGHMPAMFRDQKTRDPDRQIADLNRVTDLLAEFEAPQEMALFFEQVLKLSPDDRAALVRYGKLLEEWGRPGDALEQYKKFLKKNPNDAMARLEAGNLLAGRGFYKEAAGYYEEAVRRGPDDPVARHLLANMLARTGDYQKAIRYYGESIRLSGGDAKAHYNFGCSLAALERYDEALEQFKTALSLDPGYTDAYLNLGNCFARQGKSGDAAAAYEKALALDPANAPVHYNLGLALEKLGRTEEARGHYAGALRIEPDYETARSRLEALGQTGQIPGEEQAAGKNP